MNPDQRVLCDALLERGYRVEMWTGLCAWCRVREQDARNSQRDVEDL